MRDVDAGGLARRLQHAGIPVVDAFDSRDFGSRVVLANGLTVRSRKPGFVLTLWHGPDPVSCELHQRLAVADNVFELPAAIADLEPRIPGLLRALEGEGRDAVGEVSAYVARWKGESPRVVAASEPVDGALAVAMSGKRFSAWLGGVRFSSMWQIDRVFRATAGYTDRSQPLDHFIDFNVENHHLVAEAVELDRVLVDGTIRTARGDEWFEEMFTRSGDTWTHHESSSAARIGGPSMAARFAPAVRRIESSMPTLFEQHFEAFARRDLAEKAREVAYAQTEAASAPDQATRRRWLRHERASLADLYRSQEVAASGNTASTLQRRVSYMPMALV